MRRASALVAGIMVFAAGGCRTEAPESPAGIVEGPVVEAAPVAIGAGDPWGWALHRADRSGTPRDERVGPPMYPGIPIAGEPDR